MEILDGTWWANVLSTLVGVVAGGLISAAISFALYRRDRDDRQAERRLDDARQQADRRADEARSRIASLRAPISEVLAALGRWEDDWIKGDGVWPTSTHLDAASLGLLATGESTAESLARWIRDEVVQAERFEDDDTAYFRVTDLIEHVQKTVVSWSKAPDDGESPHRVALF